jgi:hypothetical protein
MFVREKGDSTMTGRKTSASEVSGKNEHPFRLHIVRIARHQMKIISL